MYAIGKNKVTCSSPGKKYKSDDGLIIQVPACCQPGTEIIDMGGVELEFCEYCAIRIWRQRG